MRGILYTKATKYYVKLVENDIERSVAFNFRLHCPPAKLTTKLFRFFWGQAARLELSLFINKIRQYNTSFQCKTILNFID